MSDNNHKSKNQTSLSIPQYFESPQIKFIENKSPSNNKMDSNLHNGKLLISWNNELNPRRPKKNIHSEMNIVQYDVKVSPYVKNNDKYSQFNPRRDIFEISNLEEEEDISVLESL